MERSDTGTRAKWSGGRERERAERPRRVDGRRVQYAAVYVWRDRPVTHGGGLRVASAMNSEKKELKIVAVGDGAVGKTALLNTHSTGVFQPEYVPTVMDNYACMNGDTYSYTLWDTAGQENYERIRPLCYSGTSVFLVCFAIDSLQSLASVKSRWLPEIRRECGEKIPTVLVGTKADLITSTSKEVVQKGDARKFTRDHKMYCYVETSAKLHRGITEVIQEAIQAATKPPPAFRVCRIL